MRCGYRRREGRYGEATRTALCLTLRAELAGQGLAEGRGSEAEVLPGRCGVERFVLGETLDHLGVEGRVGPSPAHHAGNEEQRSGGQRHKERPRQTRRARHGLDQDAISDCFGPGQRVGLALGLGPVERRDVRCHQVPDEDRLHEVAPASDEREDAPAPQEAREAREVVVLGSAEDHTRAQDRPADRARRGENGALGPLDQGAGGCLEAREEPRRRLHDEAKLARRLGGERRYKPRREALAREVNHRRNARQRAPQIVGVVRRAGHDFEPRVLGKPVAVRRRVDQAAERRAAFEQAAREPPARVRRGAGEKDGRQ